MPVQANSLLERLSMGRRGYAPSRQVDSLTLLTSVQRNLNRIFNTNQGSSLARPDYGFPDFNRIIANFPDAIPWLTAILTEQIRMFEPRLAAAQVRFVPDEANGPTKGAVSLNFIITAQLVQSDNAVIRFNTVFDDRKFQVSA